MEERQEFGMFLQSRRARITPEAAGIHGGSRRRVRGLRREELAQLAGVSVDYYIRLEQGRVARPSSDVLDAVARVLCLDEDDRMLLHQLARPPRPAPSRGTRGRRLRPELHHLLTLMDQVPAIVVGYRLDLLAANRLAVRLLVDLDTAAPGGCNLARVTFLEPASDTLAAGWDRCARAAVEQLRRAAQRHPDDTALATLVGELSVKSARFRRLWSSQPTRERPIGRLRLRHPVVGELVLHSEAFDVAGGGDQRLVVFVAEPNSASDTALKLLASWTAPAVTPEHSTAAG